MAPSGLHYLCDPVTDRRETGRKKEFSSIFSLEEHYFSLRLVIIILNCAAVVFVVVAVGRQFDFLRNSLWTLAPDTEQTDRRTVVYARLCHAMSAI